MRTAFEVLALASAIALAVALALPKKPTEIPPPPSSSRSSVAANSDSAAGETRSAVDPRRIAAVLGWRPPSPPAPPAPAAEPAPPPSEPEPEPEAPAPQIADWLIYTGRVVDASNRTIYVFKNNRTGRPLSLSVDEERGGWALVEVRDDSFLARQNDQLFIIER
jgi:hypothetical protein